MAGFGSSWRRFRSGARLALVVLLVSAAVCGAASAAVRVLPLGDSITRGDIGDGGVLYPSYRAWLYQDLTALGYDVDFVGSLDIPELPAGLDSDNEGHPGFTAHQVLDGLPGWLGAYPSPDVALVHLGTNDVMQDLPYNRTFADLAGIVGALRARNPNMTILVAQIIPCAFESRNRMIEALNREIAGLQALSTDQSPVVIVDQYSGYDGWADNQADTIHPLTSGEKKMAARWMASLVPVLDRFPPPGVRSLANSTYESRSVTWTWTDPADPGFADVIVYLDGSPAGVVEKGVQRFTACNLTPATAYTLGTRTRNAAGVASASWVNHTASTAPAAGPVPVPPGDRLPGDLDGDGKYEDVNGNGRADFGDVVLYFNQMTWITANEPIAAFDYNKNGRIDFADVVWLFDAL